jgi:pyruvate formate lyase activating enzyme
VDVLPYHQMGVAKYERAGKDYRLKDVTPPTTEDVRSAVRVLLKAGLKVTIRGEDHGDD